MGNFQSVDMGEELTVFSSQSKDCGRGTYKVLYAIHTFVQSIVDVIVLDSIN